MNGSKKRQLFGKSGNHGTVILNRFDTPEREYTWYGEAFHEAGKSLAEQLKNDQQFGLGGVAADSFKAVPIAYLYRHAMELYLKSIVLAGGAILPLRGQAKIDSKTVFSTHVLQRILQDVERIFAAFGWGWDFELAGFRSIADFRSVVGQLDAVKSDALRYPTLQDAKTPALKRHFGFNVFEFCEALDPVYPVLDSVAYAAHEQLHLAYENDAEAWQQELENAI
jgi:hypothetical protein